MAYESVDQLQKTLAKTVFNYAQDKKKAAGRALGTLVEVITFYLLKTWKLNDSISIESSIPEYGNPDITHNVEYSLHPVMQKYFVRINKTGQSVTANKIIKELKNNISLKDFVKKNQNLLSSNNVLRNACVIAVGKNSHLVASIAKSESNRYKICICEQNLKPYALFECKRVGIEEGNKKGPQTIEKAKQGAYVAQIVSSLQKIRFENGDVYGIIFRSDNSQYTKPYDEILKEIIQTEQADLLRKFILTVGVVSNHGNWFTSDDHNKELKVLAQSYDWLLFLTDRGLSEFIEELILNPTREWKAARNAFLASYKKTKKSNQFTKVKINAEADEVLLKYFSVNMRKISSWFNVISPINSSLAGLKRQLKLLHNKKWEEILP